MSELKTKISSTCQMHGLTLQRGAINVLAEYLNAVPTDEHQSWLGIFLEQLQQQNSDSLLVSEYSVTEAIKALQNIEEGSSEKIFTVIDAFAIPKFKQGGGEKKYVVCTETRRLFGAAPIKSEMYINRHNVIYQRLKRHELFKPSIAGDTVRGQRFKLQPVEYLLGSISSSQEDIVIFGMITQLKEGKYYLEDPTGTVLLDLTNTTGIFTEGCFVLAEGTYEDRVFRVKGLGLPPAETSEISRDFLGNLNVFGGDSSKTAKRSARLKAIEEENQNTSFVFVADIWLDDTKVLNKLRKLFEGFSLFPPTCFVFIGNFFSLNIKSSNHVFDSMKNCFHKLADMISEFPSLATSSKFVFVPGPQDPEFSEIVPRPPIPKYISNDFCNRLPGAVFTTNPCRLQYCTQEIVIFREDLVTKMCRNCLHVPEGDTIPAHFAKTLTSQSSLSPLPIHILPVYWNFDHALSLYPLPDLIVCADKYHPFTETSVGCQIINPGSFSMSNFIFKVYIPSKQLVEDSHIGED